MADSDNPSYRAPRKITGLSGHMVPPEPVRIAEVLGRTLQRVDELEHWRDRKRDVLKDLDERLDKLERYRESMIPTQAKSDATLGTLQGNIVRLGTNVDELTKLMTDVRITIARYAAAAGVIGAILGALMSGLVTWLVKK